DDKATDDLWKKVKEDHVKERAAERRWKHEEEEQRLWVEAEQKAWEEAEWLARQEAEWKKEEKAQRAEEAKQRAEEAKRAAKVQRRNAEGQCIPGTAKGKSTTCKPCHKVKASCSWSKAAGGATQKWRRMQSKEDNGDDEDNEDDEAEGEGDFMVLPALMQEHRDMLGTLMMTLSALLKEFKGYHCDQWDLQACQVRGLKALQKEMKMANALKAKELKATTKGKEKAAEVSEESSESGDEEEEVKDGCKGGVAKGEDRDGDRDIEMGAVPLASVM
ncbi:hypothetical protein ID866_11512, partial [Astraeus odoratus]